MDSLGGGGNSGGQIVQSTAPWAAMLAGQTGAAAAKAAGQASTKAMNDAINSINQNYAQARYDVQPYRTAGVAALDKLNSYMGLGAYNPGPAPTAPTALSRDDALKNITQQQINDYVSANSTGMGPSGDNRVGNTLWKYNGVGARDNTMDAGWTANGEQGQGMNAGQWGRGYFGSTQGDIASNLNNDIRGELANQAMASDKAKYDIANTAYGQNKTEYDQNKALYDQYTAAGPMTSQQVSDSISNLPGYQAELNQGINAIGKSASANGYLGSGRMLKELGTYGQKTLSTYYGNELSRLAGIAGMGQQSSSQTSTNSANQGNALAGLQMENGTNQGNALLSAAKSQSDALIGANQQFNVMGGSSGGLGGLGSLLGGVGTLMGSKAGGAGLGMFL